MSAPPTTASAELPLLPPLCHAGKKSERLFPAASSPDPELGAGALVVARRTSAIPIFLVLALKPVKLKFAKYDDGRRAAAVTAKTALRKRNKLRFA